jgi:CheY-like chemotaxis protein
MTVENTSFLYVEDDRRSREVMRLIMTKAMQIKNLDILNDSLNFKAQLNNLIQRPDVFLLDIQVEPHDGFAMLRMIRETAEFKQAKVIALTASVMNEEVEAMRIRGFDGAIAKPLNISTFPELIERIVAGEAVWHIV